MERTMIVSDRGRHILVEDNLRRHRRGGRRCGRARGRSRGQRRRSDGHVAARAPLGQL
jgi:hypothetical protein